MSVSEIVGYDSVTDSFSYIEVFRWNSVTDEFEFTGHMDSYLLEEVISLKIGLPPTRKREIYDLMFKRSEYLSKFNEQGITAFTDVYKTLAKAYREDIF